MTSLYINKCMLIQVFKRFIKKKIFFFPSANNNNNKQVKPLGVDAPGGGLTKSNISDFSEGQKPPVRWGLTIIEKSWSYGNLPYLMDNTYGLNVIKIGGNWIFLCVWGRGGGGEAPIMGVACDLWCPFLNSDELFQLKVMCENLVWIGWAFQVICVHKHFSGGGGGGGAETPY